jgi:hypothetical protein
LATVFGVDAIYTVIKRFVSSTTWIQRGLRENRQGCRRWGPAVRHSQHSSITSDTVSWGWEAGATQSAPPRVHERRSLLIPISSDAVSWSKRGGATQSAGGKEEERRSLLLTQSAPPECTSDTVCSSPSPATQSAGGKGEERHSLLLPSPTKIGPAERTHTMNSTVENLRLTRSFGVDWWFMVVLRTVVSG